MSLLYHDKSREQKCSLKVFGHSVRKCLTKAQGLCVTHSALRLSSALRLLPVRSASVHHSALQAATLFKGSQSPHLSGELVYYILCRNTGILFTVSCWKRVCQFFPFRKINHLTSSTLFKGTAEIFEGIFIGLIPILSVIVCMKKQGFYYRGRR